jgi:hypothetical protein
MNQNINADKTPNIRTGFQYFIDELEKIPFITIVGKYDHILGPRSVFSSIKLEEETFIRDLLRDALNTKSKFVILNFAQFYAQIYKIHIEDKSARGGQQLYSIILIRHMDAPLIPEIHFKRLEMMFRRIGKEKILSDKPDIFKRFYEEILEIYTNKNEIVPFESFNIQIRSGVNTIQGFCELIRERGKLNSHVSNTELQNYIDLMLGACDDIIDTLEKDLKGILK